METERREKLKKRHVAWLERLMNDTGKKAHALAKEAGIAPSTLYNVLDADKATVLTSDTIDRIVTTFNFAGPEITTNGSGFAEPEAVRLEPETADKTLTPCHPGQSVWRLNTRALELPPYGYQPGWEILIDDRVSPQAHDVVCANTADGQTVWRVFVPPFYLLTATADMSIAPQPLIVGHDAAIMGTVIRAISRRRDVPEPSAPDERSL